MIQNNLNLPENLKLIRKLVRVGILLILFGDLGEVKTLWDKPLSTSILGKKALSQIIPDNTLGNENSQVIPNQNINSLPAELIEGGAQRGQNLFHSFSQFNIEAGRGAYFANPEGVANIFSRVTGNDISNILGTLGVSGSADLFFINPNGIIFGENASLDVNGSFMGSTAQSIVFGNDFEFSAVNHESPPLLTINMPVGLNLGSNEGDITVQGVGNNLSLNPETSSIVRDSRPVGLEVNSDRTLALVGGNITLEGGNLTAPGGRIELGSVGEGEVVKLTPTNSGWTLSYEDVLNFQDIALSQKASVDASGSEGSSSVWMQGRQVTVTEQSAILAQPLGEFPGGELTIKASEEIVVSGFDIDLETVELDTFPSTISTDVQPGATGNAGSLLFETKSLRIIDVAQIGSGTFGIGNGATLSVKAEKVEISGSISFLDEEGFISFVRPGGLFNASELGAIGNGGNIEIETKELLISDGSTIATFAREFSQGNAGNINITAEKIEIIGRNLFERSSIRSDVSQEATGKGGNINIKSQELQLNSGAIFTSTLSDSDAGNLSIEAESIRLNNKSVILGTTQGEGNGGNITIETNNLLVDFSEIGTGTFSTGNAGELKITSQDIEVIGSPSTTFTGIYSSGGLGDGNNLTIETKRLRILNGGQIAADTFGTGSGGDLDIQALEKVEVRGENIFEFEGEEPLIVPSKLTVEATENSNAGDLSLETGELIIADGGQVTVSSPQGEAGNLEVTADSLLLDRGTLSAETGSNINLTGANINLQIANNLQLSNESLITATAFETANGGNITIDAGFILAFPLDNTDGSDIIANADEGGGGLIAINAQGIFGLETRTQLTNENDITAFSEQNPQLNGTIELNIPEVSQNLSLLQLPNIPVSAKVVQSCKEENSPKGSQFVVSGRGSLPDSPQGNLNSDFGLEDWRVFVEQDSSAAVSDRSLSPSHPAKSKQIVEANSLIFGDRGKLILIADNSDDLASNWTHQLPTNCPSH